jgi:glucose uptake protein GlcU
MIASIRTDANWDCRAKPVTDLQRGLMLLAVSSVGFLVGVIEGRAFGRAGILVALPLGLALGWVVGRLL